MEHGLCTLRGTKDEGKTVIQGAEKETGRVTVVDLGAATSSSVLLEQMERWWPNPTLHVTAQLARAQGPCRQRCSLSWQWSWGAAVCHRWEGVTRATGRGTEQSHFRAWKVVTIQPGVLTGRGGSF